MPDAARQPERIFHATNGLRLSLPGGYVVSEDAALAQASPALMVAAQAEARDAGEDVGLAAQQATAWTPPKPMARNLVPVAYSREAAEAPIVGWAIANIIPEGEVTLGGGHGGIGKSMLFLTLAVHKSIGRAWAGHECEAGPVVFVSLEDGAAVVQYRVRRICEAHGLDRAAVMANLRIVDGTEGDSALVTEYAEGGVRRIGPTATWHEFEDVATGARLIVVDNASDAFDGDENNRRQVRQFVRMLRNVARADRAGLILLAHIDKQAARFGAGRNSYSGSTAWHNSARSRLALVEKEGQVQLIHEKSNFGPRADPLVLRWTERGVLMPSGVTAHRELHAEDEQAVLEALTQAAAAGVDVGAARTGPATAQAVLGTFDALPARLRNRSGRDAFWSALGRLTNRGAVEVREITTSARHSKRVLVIAGSRVQECARNTPTTPCAEPANRRRPAGVRQLREPAQTGETCAADHYKAASRGG